MYLSTLDPPRTNGPRRTPMVSPACEQVSQEKSASRRAKTTVKTYKSSGTSREVSLIFKTAKDLYFTHRKKKLKKI